MYACHFQCLALSLENDIFTEICYLLNCDDKSFGVIGRRGIKTLSLLPISVITVAFTTFVPRKLGYGKVCVQWVPKQCQRITGRREWVFAWIRQQPSTFYTEAIHSLPMRWDPCINVNGDYF
ncbi:hypothetical protein AVEN_48037-1 [Araneus ventricosus]|uniref:Uncharacterized protein n=1 Tax=Araneus ventricosus TaxID=182803 RepID=A0A4Y2M221_ARAVE|nr:hypothetical protein AVEN_48037-1 [Araneus ventricosus]